MPVELAGVDAGDAAVGSAAGVDDDEVAVEVGVAEAAGAVVEAGDDQPGPVEVGVAAVAAAHDGGLGFQQRDDGLLGSVEGVFDVSSAVGVADGPVEDRERLGDADGGVEPGIRIGAR